MSNKGTFSFTGSRWDFAPEPGYTPGHTITSNTVENLEISADTGFAAFGINFSTFMVGEGFDSDVPGTPAFVSGDSITVVLSGLGSGTANGQILFGLNNINNPDNTTTDTYTVTLGGSGGTGDPYTWTWLLQTAPCLSLQSILSVRLPADVYIKNKYTKEHTWVSVPAPASPLLLTPDHLVMNQGGEIVRADAYTDNREEVENDVVDLVSSDGRFIDVKGTAVKTSRYLSD